MRQNLPVNNKDVRVRSDQYLISKTDLKGRIIYTNPAFIEISGFSPDELRGKAYNIVRHPDMPPPLLPTSGKPYKLGNHG